MEKATEIPKTIWTIWLQGEENLPPLAALCIRRWRRLNPDYAVRLLDQGDVVDLLADFPLDLNDLPPQALADIARKKLLTQHGGVWADAALFPVVPLSAWLPEAAEAGFFAFDRPGPDRPISNWFLVAQSESLIMQRWWKATLNFWDRPRTLIQDPRTGNAKLDDPVGSVAPDRGGQSDRFPYFWPHYLFAYLIETDDDFATSWAACRKLSAGPPHKLQQLFSGELQPTSVQLKRAIWSAPVQKLNWRTDIDPTTLERLEQWPAERAREWWPEFDFVRLMRRVGKRLKRPNSIRT